MKKGFKEQGNNIANVEKKIDQIQEIVNDVPTREDFPELLRTALDFITLKAEHDRMKNIIKEKLNVEV